MNEIEAHYRANYKRLVKVISPRVDRNNFIAEECVQEAYTNALDYYPKLKNNIDDFEAWFRTILNNVCNKYKSAERERGIVTDDLESLAAGDELDHHFRHLSQKLKTDISEVSHIEHRKVLDLYFNKNMKPREIYYLVDKISNSGVRTIIQRFRDAMREKYEVLRD